MPTQAYGVYPAEGTVGDQVSSTYEGRHLTMQASELTHAGAVVTKGLPVVFGVVLPGNAGVGIALNTEVAGTDLIAIDTEGIWNVSVVATDDAGAMLVTGGDPLYINTTTCIVSKIRNNVTQIPFGYALGQVAADATAVIAVKLHWNPPAHWLLDSEPLYFGDTPMVTVTPEASQLNFVQATNWACPAGTGRVVRMSGNPTLQAGSQSATLALFNNPIGTGATWAGALQAHFYQSAVKAVDGYMAAGLFSIENEADNCSTAAVIALSWKNKALIGFGGVMHSFIQIREYSTGGPGGGNDCINLFEMPDHDATDAAAADQMVCQAGAAVAASHVIRVTIGGVPYWIMMDSTPPA